MGKPRKKFWLDDKNEENLSDVEIELYDKFFVEYMHDFNIINAAIRCGFSIAFAKDHGQRMFTSPYIQRKLKEHYGSDNATQKSDIELVKATLRNVMLNGTWKDRVSAAGQMKGILGIDAPIKTQQVGSEHRGGVLRLPSIANLNQWEKTAIEHQREIMKDQSDESTS